MIVKHFFCKNSLTFTVFEIFFFFIYFSYSLNSLNQSFASATLINTVFSKN